MINRSLLTIAGVLLLANPVFSQFGQSNRLSDLAARLSRTAADFAEQNYNNYSNSSRNARNDIEAVMLSQQFAGAAQTFNRMVIDRRRNSELRDALDVLSNVARSVERNNFQRNTWSNVQRLMSDISSELNYDRSHEGSGDQYPDAGNSSGRMTWRGHVDDDVRIRIRGGSAEVETIGGTPYYDGQPNFFNALPNRRVTVRLAAKRGRGDIFIEQQPSRENDFTAIIRIKDPKGGASQYEFELQW